MNNSPHITDEEWDRIRKHIADNPETAWLETNEEGTMVVYRFGAVRGAMHPRAYLEMMEDDEPFDDEPVDILKHVSNATAPDALIGTMPGSLRGVETIPPFKPKPPETE